MDYTIYIITLNMLVITILCLFYYRVSRILADSVSLQKKIYLCVLSMRKELSQDIDAHTRFLDEHGSATVRSQS